MKTLTGVEHYIFVFLPHLKKTFNRKYSITMPDSIIQDLDHATATVLNKLGNSLKLTEHRLPSIIYLCYFSS